MGVNEFVHSKPRAGNFLSDLDKEAVARSRTIGTSQVLLCFTCDPYQALDAKLGTTRQVIQILHRHGFSVCTLTKGGKRALRDLDLFTAQDAFATSLTLLDPATSRRWEPDAALPDERIATLQAFHAASIPTWVSLEPVLDPAAALEIIRRTHGFVDLYKIGKLNHHSHAQTIDWRKWANESTALLDSLGKRYYVKDDLRVFLTRQPVNAVSRAALETLITPPETAEQLSMF